MNACCGFSENELSLCSKEEGVTLADSVETLGEDSRTRVKKLGAKEKARRRKCKVRFSIIKKNKAFQKNCMKVGAHAVVMSPTEMFKLRRQMAAAAGKKSTTSYGLEVEEELSTMATQNWAEGVWTGKWPHEQIEGRFERYWLVGCKPVSSMPQGGRHRKAQALPLSRVAWSQAGNSGGLQKVGAKGENVKGVEVAKRYRRAPSQ